MLVVDRMLILAELLLCTVIWPTPLRTWSCLLDISFWRPAITAILSLYLLFLLRDQAFCYNRVDSVSGFPFRCSITSPSKRVNDVYKLTAPVHIITHSF